MEKNSKTTKNEKSEVKVYTTNMCPWCIKTKEFLKENNIKYKDFNVNENDRARNEMFEKSGQFGVPVIDINGSIIIGFDRNALKKVLKI
ncbi:MAG TPA: glutaredoxin domain-containing protein [Candidatus Nanoarchaeia archaeon]|nr:glutaredoxin domain-containing protein [Candidatus Nanoarchaeia archaeon]